MTLRIMIRRTLFLVVLMTAVFSLGHHRSKPPTRFNVLFIAVDDLRARIGPYGEIVETPNIDRLARMGRRFLRAYSQVPMCSPSRASVMSGWRPQKTGVYGNLESVREFLEGAVPLQEHFSANGYFTARVGKIYHTRFEKQFKWDVSEDFVDRRSEASAQGPLTGAKLRTAEPPEERYQEKEIPIWGPTDDEDGDTADGKTARRVAELLEQHRNERFFVAAGFLRPHFPLLAPQKYFDLYDAESIQFQPSPVDDRDDIPRIALRPGANVAVEPSERAAVLRAYYACVSFMDAQVGVLLETMDRLDLWRDTIVVFWSDHGFHLGEHGGLWRKSTLFEESTRVPLLFVAPGMKQAGVPTRHLAELVDIYPTLLELCNLPWVEGLEGASLVPLLRNPEQPIKTAAFSVVQRLSGLGRSVRTDRYRYTQWPDGSRELFDHESDPEEYINLEQFPVHSRTVAEMKALLRNGYRSALNQP